MQRSLHSYFTTAKPAGKKEEDDFDSPRPKKRKARVISSDEDEVPESPHVSKSRDHKKTRTEHTKSPKAGSSGGGSSGSSSKKKSTSTSKHEHKKELKRIDPTALFGGETVRIEAKKPPKPKDKAIIELEDDEIDKSLLSIDMDEGVILSADKEIKETKAADRTPKKSPHKSSKADKSQAAKDKTPSKSPHKSGKSPRKEKLEARPELIPKKSPHKLSHSSSSSSSAKKLVVEPDRAGKKSPHKSSKKSEPKEEKNGSTDKVEEKKKETENEENLTPPSAKKAKQEKETTKAKETPKADKKKGTPRAKKEPAADLESSVLSDEERHERKRMAAMQYQRFKNRAGCPNPGSKEVPKGKPNCLAGLNFIVTGVLESLERDEAGSIIKELGGKVMSTMSKKLNYVIVGEEAGLKKLAQAEENGTKILSEDEFLDLIRTKSGETPKYKKPEETKKVSPKTKETSPEKKRKLETKSSKEDSKHIKVKKEMLDSDEEMKTAVKKETLEAEHEIKREIKKEVKNEFMSVPEKFVSEDMLAWVDKYKPMNVKEIIGQQGAASNVTKLTNWLSKWYINHDGKKKLQKPNPWAKNDDGSFFKAALLSGPPGIGKTTTATLVCKELGFDAVEFNASDTRSKRLLKEEVSELLSNKSLYGYFHGHAQAMTKKHVLIMDEVDGMAGNEDRGGIQELIGLIKDSSVPIICMCNDRNHQKMRSLVNYCYDLRFNKPRLPQIKACILSICCKEKIKIDSTKIEEIITATNFDIRQSINHISLLSAGKELQLKSDNTKMGEKTAEKDLKMGPWEVVRKVFSADEHKHMNFNDKCDLFFHDYSMAPLFVQQNYLQVSPAGPKSEITQKVALAADALSLGDMVDKRIRSNMAWSLLPTQAVFSSVMPGAYMSGHFTGQINFPGWLGKYSRSNKRSRLAQEIHDHTRARTSGSRQSVRLDYAPFLLSNIVRPLKERGMEGVEESLQVLKEYHLLREDIDSLVELTSWPGKKGIMDAVDGRVKAALTRTYNKEVLAYSYSAMAGVKKKKAEAADESELLAIEGDEEGTGAAVASDEEKDDALENDGLIKAKKKPAASTSAKASSSKSKSTKTTKASTSSKSKK